MKRKTIILALLLILLVTALLVVGNGAQPNELTAQEREYLRQKETIVFVSQTRYPPFEFLAADGAHSGMCIELAHWMGTEMGFKARFTDTSFAEAQEAILSGQADVLTSFFYSKERDAKFEFTQMMFQVPASIFVEVKRADINGLADLDGKRIAMQEGDYALEFLQAQNIAFDVVYTNDFGEATDMVLAGEADAIIGDEPIVLYHIHSMDLSHRIKIVGEPLYIGQNSMATRDDERLLTSILNKGLDRARRAGALEHIEQKWLGTRPPAPEFKYLPHLIVAVVGLLATILFIWLWNLSLRRKVRERTAELSESEERYRALYQDNPSMYFTVDKAGAVLSVNKFGAEHLGYTIEELVGQQVLGMFHPDDQEAAQRYLETCFQNPGRTKRWELRKMHKDGGLLWVKETVQVVHRTDGAPIALIVCDDITERVRSEQERARAEEALQESSEKIRAMFKSATDGITFTDLRGNVVETNEAVVRLHDYDNQEEIIGQSSLDFIAERDRSRAVENLQKTLRDGYSGVVEYKFLTKDGMEFDAELSAVLLRDGAGNPSGFVALTRNITERKQAERKLKRYREHLEELVEERTRELREAQAELLRKERLSALGQLTATVAHEIRNPLGTVRTAVFAIGDAIQRDELHRLERMRQLAERNIIRCDNIITELLDYARGRERDRTLNLEPIYVDNWLGKVLDEQTIPESIVCVRELDAGIQIHLDRERLRRAVINVVENAVQAMQEQASPDHQLTISTRVVKIKDSPRLEILVRDTGPGIPADLMDKVFEPLFSTKAFGVGLGLPVVESVMRQHGGGVEIESLINQGTTLTLWLPLKDVDGEQTQGAKK